jgi:predicted DNA-binding ribbon-helix-helix protein
MKARDERGAVKIKSRKPDHRLARRDVVTKDSATRTSVSLERVVWQTLREIAAEQGKTFNQLVMEIDRTRTLNRSAAIRIYIIEYYRAALEKTRG